MNDKPIIPRSPKWCQSAKNEVYTRRYNKSALKAPIVLEMMQLFILETPFCPWCKEGSLWATPGQVLIHKDDCRYQKLIKKIEELEQS